jgi:hypothetical protein
MEGAEIAAKLDSITNVEEQAQALEDAVNALEDTKDASCVAPILRLFERCGTQDDFGMYQSLINVIEQFDDESSRLAVQASARRAPAWPTLQILGGFSTPSEKRAILEQILAEGSFKDPRYDRGWLEKQLAEIE